MRYATGVLFRQLCAVMLFLFLNFTLEAQPYHFYYGNIHAHSEFSDGNDDSDVSMCHDPADDYTFAKSTMNFDFLGISDHNHSGAGMARPNYHIGVIQAQEASEDGIFVALYGMEYGVINSGGHLLIYGIDSLIGWNTGNYDIYCNEFDYKQLFGIVNARPNAFASLAHPQWGDYNDLDGSDYDGAADDAITGAAIRSGYAFSTTSDYSDDPAPLYEPYFKKMLSKGYHLGPSIDHDNHNTTFGRTTQGRTVVLAASKTKTDILAALKASRYFASDDWNAQVNFTVDGFYMGSSGEITGNPAISASVSDLNNESISKIELFYGVPGSNVYPSVLTTAYNTSSLNYTHDINVGSSYYYYLKITQADGDLIWTAPVWITRIFGESSLELLDFQAFALESSVRVTWQATVAGTGTFAVERAANGIDFETLTVIPASGQHDILSFSFDDENPVSGTGFYRIRWRENTGQTYLSPVLSVYLFKMPIKLTSLSPNPTRDFIIAGIDAKMEDTNLWYFLYNAAGMEVRRSPFGVLQGANQVKIEMKDQPAGQYFLVLGRPGERMVETVLTRVR